MVNRRDRVGLAVLAALVILAPIVAAVLIARDVPSAHAARSSVATLAADSAAGDAAAIAALPEGLRALFDVGAHIAGVDANGAATDRTPSVTAVPLRECLQLPATPDSGLRRHLQLRLPDSSVAVLYTVADQDEGTLERVEFLRRMPRAGQRGFIWDATRDRTTSVWWFESPRGMRRTREERGTIPRGSPLPRAVRGLGRQLLVAPCDEVDANSPMNPISGSRD